MASIIEPRSALAPASLIKTDPVVVRELLVVEKGHANPDQRASRRSSFFARFSTPLPAKHHIRIVRHARHTFLNVYRRLFSLVFLFNLIGLWVCAAKYKTYSQAGWLANLANAASANVMVALLIRQDYIVNMLFRYVIIGSLSLRCSSFISYFPISS
jgi:hypothetical protein